MMPTTAEPAEVMHFNKARFDGDTFVIDEDTNHDQWKDIGHRLKWAARRVQFCIGDWLRFGEKKGFTGKYTDRKVYDELEAITGLDRKTIQNYKYVAEHVPDRREDLHFGHHAEVAALPPKHQQRFLQIASDEKLTVRQLREKITPKHDFEINGRIAEEKKLREAIGKDDMRKLDERVKELLTEINSLPLICRIKIKQGISRKV